MDQIRDEQWIAEEQQAIRLGTLTKSKNEDTLYVPMLQYGQAIGVIKLVKREQSRWSDAEVQLVLILASQLSDSLEAARLYDDAQRRASKERVIGEVTTKISQSINLRNVLQTAVEELGHVIPGSDVIIQLQDKHENGKKEKQLL